jgi:hypothetical protein
MIKKTAVVLSLLLATGSVYGGSDDNGKSDNSNKNANTNRNKNTNRNLNAQGQLQGQLQGQVQGQLQGQNQSTTNANNASQTVNVQGDNFEVPRIPVSTAYAPMIAPTANCALGVSGGVQTVGFGASFGKAYIDENCAKLEKIRNVSQVLGDKQTAEALMCQDQPYRQARASVGRPCPVEQE